MLELTLTTTERSKKRYNKVIWWIYRHNDAREVKRVNKLNVTLTKWRSSLSLGVSTGKSRRWQKFWRKIAKNVKQKVAVGKMILMKLIGGDVLWTFRFAVLPPSTFLFTVGVEGFYFHFITLKHTPQPVGLLWTRDRPVAGTSTWQHKHCTRDKRPCLRWDSNVRSQQALGRRPTPYIARLLGSAVLWTYALKTVEGPTVGLC
jgi:hypothetical protein